MTFGTFSLSTIALAGLYVWGVWQKTNAARGAGRSWTASFVWALAWPLSGWKLQRDLLKAPPPAE